MYRSKSFFHQVLPGDSGRLGAACLAFALVAAVATPAAATEWFVDPNGSAAGAGTINDPWDIYALDARDANGVIDPNAPVQPGDTVWLRGGLYQDPNRRYDHQGYEITLGGSVGNRVTVRNYNGERAIVDPGLTFRPGAAYVDLWGLEFQVAENMLPGASRRSYYWAGGYDTPGFYDPNGNLTLDIPHGGILVEEGTSIRLINNYIHHMTKNSLWLFPAVTGEVTVHGNIIRDGGFIGYRPATQTGRPEGHYGDAIKLGHISSDTWTISDNIIEDNFAIPLNTAGGKFWADPNDPNTITSQACQDVTAQGNFIKMRFGITEETRSMQLTFIAVGGGGDSAERNVFDQNIQWGGGLRFSDESFLPDPPVETYDNTFTDNYLIHGRFRWMDNPTDPNINPTIHHNLVTSGNVEYIDETWDGEPNTYSPPTWTDPPIVDLRPNDFEADRANLAIVQPGGSAADIDVDFGSWLANYHRFELKDPADLWGTAVFSSTYTGSNIAVPVGGEEYSTFVAFDLGLLGDFNESGSVTSTDVDMLWPRFGNAVPPEDEKYDLTDDDQVTFADAQKLVQVIVGTSMADTNLDMEVGIMDLGNLAGKYGQAGVFSNGDTDGNGLINIMDLGNLAGDYGKTYSAGAPPVPEPASLALLALGGLAVIRRRR